MDTMERLFEGANVCLTCARVYRFMTDLYALIEGDLDKVNVWVIGMNPAINPKVAKALQARQEF